MGGPKGSKRGTTRWRPTAEQLMILEELFKGGIKSPTSQQVQKITARLKEHGKVESKNVFYWFQNHKAREKQKLRKTHKDVLCYANLLPHPHFASPFLPFFTPQVLKGQWISSQAEMVDFVTRKDEDNINVSSWAITWLPTDSDSDHHRNNRPLKTLQLFPTTAAAATSSKEASTSASSNISSSNTILISL
ncbi:hypothetical protein V2J09_004563 [Rumex salicifolius]